ncbi:MAG: alpha/beta hydrolase [Armatimonadetes bacterium]|nr:alpha/beta hydrolase [Armatimonadota bacterium]
MFTLALLALLLQADPPTTGIVYREVDGQRLMMDLYPAAGRSAKAPVVVVIHGGAWMSGSREDMSALCTALSLNGMVAATVDYRLAPRSKWPAMLDDVRASVRFLRANAERFGIDPDRVGAAGVSSGAHLALMLGFSGTWSSRVMAVLNLFGPTDLTKDYSPFLAQAMSEQVLGKDLADATEDIRAFSPVTYVTSDDAPVFTVHGRADLLVPYVQAERLDKALRGAGVAHTMLLVDGMEHGIKIDHKVEMEAVSKGVAFMRATLVR